MTSPTRVWIYDLLLIPVLIAATALRVVGLNWDDNQHLHPDERFLTMVETALQVKQCSDPNLQLEACPPDEVRWLGLGEYLNTAASPLNPQNRGFGFFVYGDFPIILVRYIAEWVGQTGYDQVQLVGRQVSALGDLLTILLIYIVAARLYDRRVALLTAAFSSVSVLQIQLSHFFIVDTVANLFIFAALYLAVEILLRAGGTNGVGVSTIHEVGRDDPAADVAPEAAATHDSARSPSGREILVRLGHDPFFLLSLGFGVALGLAVASKLNAAPLAVVLPGAFLTRYFLTDRSDLRTQGPGEISAYWSRIAFYLIAGGVAAVLTFRLAQPYAFQGLGLNRAWLDNITSLEAQSNGSADVPFALQWARRSHLFSFENLTRWGLGLPLGILAWVGFVVMGWRIFKGELKHLLLWGWTGLYFGWQSTVFNPTMRYQLPVYPLLCMIAAWVLIHAWDQRNTAKAKRWRLVYGGSAVIVGSAVLVLSAAWAFAFTRIYTRPVTRVAASEWIYQNVPGPINLRIQTSDGSVYEQPLPITGGESLQANTPYMQVFSANASGTLLDAYFPHAAATQAGDTRTLRISIGVQANPTSTEQPLTTASVTRSLGGGGDGRGEAIDVPFSQPAVLQEGGVYYLHLEADGPMAMAGAAPINESDWDDGLPLRMDGYDAYGGLYAPGLNLQIYYDDNADKLKRFVDTLTQGDYLFMSSNRQWATVTRIPERYPLTTVYYRDLIGCPPDKDVIWCYNVATPGMFEGKLGYKLVAVFESFPTLDIPGVLHWQANDQFAEEAFTVYDHPKVLIFQKEPQFSRSEVQRLLGAVDLSNVVHLTPGEAGGYKSLMLSAAQWARQRAGGTWSQLFSYQWLQNRFQLAGLVIWYVFVLILGLLMYPVIRLALPGLGDKGYPLARVLGMLLLAYLPWLGGSLGLPVTRLAILVVLAVLSMVGLALGWKQRAELAEEWRSRRKYFLMIEGLFLAFFLFDLLIRLGNPDLWHPAKGGERPMDFSFFNAVIKSTTFPPYDPWFAGGYINYYYFGFLLVAMPVKLLGIVPSLAYNFILPTLYAMVALGAFCVAWNLVEAGDPDDAFTIRDRRLWAGLLAAALMVVVGNLGTVRMIYQGLQRLAAPGGAIDPAGIVQRLIWAVQGLAQVVGGAGLPYGRGEWYWNPSRVIPPGPGNEITEFPFFTFLYSDLHAHMLAMPLALLALAWALSVVKARRITLFSIVIGGLAIGALYPTNLSDIYTYLPIGFAVLAYSIWRADNSGSGAPGIRNWVRKSALTLASILLLTALAYGFYEPYRAAYSQGYGALEAWTASHTPFWSYLTHWGVFLFIITAWLAWETRQWLASTPVSALNKLRSYQMWIEAALAVFIVGLLYLAYRGVEVGWVAWPLGAWAGVLLLRPGLPDAKRFVLFLTGTALAITIVVEIFVVRGDIGRMNTIFKFYLQGWALLSVSAAAAFVWILQDIGDWLPGWRSLFGAGTTLLLVGAALYTVSATTDKINDRMAPGVPLTLDTSTYMQYAHYTDFGVTMDLDQDFKAIRWMQDHVEGSPVIVEANCPEYRWCTRFTIYTGLPGVVGWNWHERQQRTLAPQLVEDRVSEVGTFYTTTDLQQAQAFLQKYDVRYIVVGQLERAEYQGAGLVKFVQYDGKLWDTAYREGETTIYKVRP